MNGTLTSLGLLALCLCMFSPFLAGVSALFCKSEHYYPFARDEHIKKNPWRMTGEAQHSVISLVVGREQQFTFDLNKLEQNNTVTIRAGLCSTTFTVTHYPDEIVFHLTNSQQLWSNTTYILMYVTDLQLLFANEAGQVMVQWCDGRPTIFRNRIDSFDLDVLLMEMIIDLPDPDFEIETVNGKLFAEYSFEAHQYADLLGSHLPTGISHVVMGGVGLAVGLVLGLLVAPLSVIYCIKRQRVQILQLLALEVETTLRIHQQAEIAAAARPQFDMETAEKVKELAILRGHLGLGLLRAKSELGGREKS